MAKFPFDIRLYVGDVTIEFKRQVLRECEISCFLLDWANEHLACSSNIPFLSRCLTFSYSRSNDKHVLSDLACAKNKH